MATTLRDQNDSIEVRPATSVGEWIDHRLPILTGLSSLREPVPANPPQSGQSTRRRELVFRGAAHLLEGIAHGRKSSA
jgi:hypothetical protein